MPIEAADVVQPFECRSVGTVQSAHIIGDNLAGQRRGPDTLDIPKGVAIALISGITDREHADEPTGGW